MVVDEKIKNMILEICKTKESYWEPHITGVVKYSKMLCEKFGADEKVCLTSAWLHDIAKMKGQREDHHLHGAVEAERILKELGFKKEFIEKVKHCITTHSSDKKYPPKTIEAKILSTADEFSHFDSLVEYIYLYSKKGLTTYEAREKLLKLIERGKDKVMPEALPMIQPKFDAVKLLFEINND